MPQQLPQLDALKLLAQTLLEAHAELAAKQNQQQQQQQHPLHQEQAAALAPATGAAPSPAVAESPLQLVYDALLGTQGDKSINSTCRSGAINSSSTTCKENTGEMANTGGASPPRPLLPTVQPVSSTYPASGIEGDSIYDESFAALLKAVENMQQPATQVLCSNKMWAGGLEAINEGCQPDMHFYEENDLLELINLL